MTRHAPMFAQAPALAILVAAAALSGCAQPSPRGGGATAAGRTSPAVSLACRQEVDRVYAAQNRRDLSLRDQRDTPFAESYNSGVTTRGLGAMFDQDNRYASCVRNNTPAGASTAAGAPPGASTTGPTFSPVGK